MFRPIVGGFAKTVRKSQGYRARIEGAVPICIGEPQVVDDATRAAGVKDVANAQFEACNVFEQFFLETTIQSSPTFYE